MEQGTVGKKLDRGAGLLKRVRREGEQLRVEPVSPFCLLLGHITKKGRLKKREPD